MPTPPSSFYNEIALVAHARPGACKERTKIKIDREGGQIDGGLVRCRPSRVAVASEPLRMLLSHGSINTDMQAEFWSQLAFHGMTLRRRTFIVLQQSLYSIERIACKGRG